MHTFAIDDQKPFKDAFLLKNHFFETSIEAISIADANGVITEANPSFLTTWGYSDQSDVIGKHLVAFHLDHQKASEIFTAVNEKGVWEGEFIGLKRDGSTFNAFGRFTRINNNGHFLGYQSSAINVTRWKQGNKELLENEEKYRSLMEQSVDMMFLQDLYGNFLDVNTAAIARSGFTRNELLNMNVFDIFSEKTCRDDILRWWANMGNSQSITLEAHHAAKNGDEYPVEIKAGKVQFGGKDYILTLVRDITVRKEVENALNKVRENLEQRVAERTELAETRAAQLQFLAVELIEAEEKERQRIAELLHDDLQQILASAKMQLQMACQSLPPVSGLIEVNKLLEESIAKSRSLSHELSPVVVYHTGLCNGLKWLAGQLDEQFGLKIHLEMYEDQKFKNKPLRLFLFRAVQELLFNIIKHAGVKSARVTLSVSDHELDITVSDQGVGFDPEIMNSPEGRSGLGLLSLRERVQAMGGSLSISSTPGQGSIISLKVPLALTDDERKLNRIERRRQPIKYTIDGSPLPPPHRNDAPSTDAIRVLFVDDHKVMRQGLINLMTNQPGIKVVGEASNGREAIEKARLLQPDVVVMDVSMPEMDGVEATRRIKSQFPEMRVICLSMYADAHIVQVVHKAGAEAFISKSGSSSELLKAIYGLKPAAKSVLSVLMEEMK